ncbi:GATA transcription factor 19 [Hibiscus syriacus]|uniref:GATA transcription factor 19 n=1 Tax=Hibiscus syriacus TaxID=106335 RepID=A0A6A2Z235_HIBSY|nr:GATA transcription factor 19 [Hibiscus syriacus]
MAFGACSCGVFHHSQSNSFSVFPCRTANISMKWTCTVSRPLHRSSVDCTLSLGTPSTRLCENNDNKRFRHERHSSSFCLQDKNIHYSQQSAKASRGSNGNSSSILGNDALLVRRCANCDTTSTPLWRNGPRGPKSLCNAWNSIQERRKKSSKCQQLIRCSGFNVFMGSSFAKPENAMFLIARQCILVHLIEILILAIPFLSWPTSLAHDFRRQDS